jgi:hypothetical protein
MEAHSIAKGKEAHRGREISAHEAARPSLIGLSAFVWKAGSAVRSSLERIFPVVAIGKNR